MIHEPHTLSCCLLLLVLGAPTSARSDPHSHLRDAIEQHNQGRFEDAVRLLEAARREARSPSLLARVHLELGINFAILGKTDLARSAFATALTHDPALEIDAEVVKKPVVALFREERARLRAELRVSSPEVHAIVSVDGKRVGRCPLVLRLPVGVHLVEVWDGEGRRLVHRRVVLAPGAVVQVGSGSGEATGSTASRSTPAGPTSRAVLAEEPASPRRRRIWTWVAAGGAVAFAGAGLGLWLSGRAGYDEYLTTTDHARFLELEDSVPRRYHAADAMLGVAVVLAVTSAVLLVVEARGRRAEPRAAWLVPAGLGLRGEL